MSARAAARAEFLRSRVPELKRAGFTEADAVAQAHREFDTGDSLDFKTRGLATGELTRNARGELVDQRGRVVFAADADDRRQRIDPDVDERDPEDEGDPNAVTPATLQREVHIDVRGSHGSGRRRRKKPPAPDAVDQARSYEREKSVERGGPGRPLDGLEPKTYYLGRVEPRIARELMERTGLEPRELLEELHRLVEEAANPATALRALEKLERMFIGYSAGGEQQHLTAS